VSRPLLITPPAPLSLPLSLCVHPCPQGVGITTPYRDKNAPNACLLMEGPAEAVSVAAAHVNAYFQVATARPLHCLWPRPAPPCPAPAPPTS